MAGVSKNCATKSNKKTEKPQLVTTCQMAGATTRNVEINREDHPDRQSKRRKSHEYERHLGRARQKRQLVIRQIKIVDDGEIIGEMECDGRPYRACYDKNSPHEDTQNRPSEETSHIGMDETEDDSGDDDGGDPSSSETADDWHQCPTK